MGELNREVLKTHSRRPAASSSLKSDRPWVLDGANVHVSMVGFDDGSEKSRVLDGKTVPVINVNLTATADTTKARRLRSNGGIGFIADVKAGKFDLAEESALNMLGTPNPHGLPNSDVLLPWVNSLDILRRPRNWWIVDFSSDSDPEAAARFEAPFAKLKADVLPERSKVKRKSYRAYWWIHAEPCDEMRRLIQPLPRFLVTTTVSKHRVFAWLSSPTLPDHQLVAFGRADAFFFGVLHSRLHEVWAFAQGTQLREKESGFRYTPTTCFETFPFPFPDDLESPAPKPLVEPPSRVPNPVEAEMLAAKYYSAKESPIPYQPMPRTPEEHRAAIADAATELNDLRERWLNPPEWTETRFLEFPGTVGGPWDRYIDPSTLNPQRSTGLVRYPRLEPRDADCAARLKPRTLTNLYNERPTWLDLAHKKLDAAVADAYGWSADLTDDQILEKLLALNLERAAEEQKAAKVKPPRTSRQKHADELV